MGGQYPEMLNTLQLNLYFSNAEFMYCRKPGAVTISSSIDIATPYFSVISFTAATPLEVDPILCSLTTTLNTENPRTVARYARTASTFSSSPQQAASEKTNTGVSPARSFLS